MQGTKEPRKVQKQLGAWKVSITFDTDAASLTQSSHLGVEGSPVVEVCVSVDRSKRRGLTRSPAREHHQDDTAE